MAIKRDRLIFNKLPEIIDLKTAAMVLGVHPETLRLMVKRGEVKAFRLGKKLWRFYRDDLKEFNERL